MNVRLSWFFVRRTSDTWINFDDLTNICVMSVISLSLSIYFVNSRGSFHFWTLSLNFLFLNLSSEVPFDICSVLWFIRKIFVYLHEDIWWFQTVSDNEKVYVLFWTRRIMTFNIRFRSGGFSEKMICYWAHVSFHCITTLILHEWFAICYNIIFMKCLRYYSYRFKEFPTIDIQYDRDVIKKISSWSFFW